MFANAKKVEAQLVHQFDLFQQFPQAFPNGLHFASGIKMIIAKHADAEFHTYSFITTKTQ
jgi:hypothetical protein